MTWTFADLSDAELAVFAAESCGCVSPRRAGTRHGFGCPSCRARAEIVKRLEPCPNCVGALGDRDHPALRFCPPCRRLGAQIRPQFQGASQ